MSMKVTVPVRIGNTDEELGFIRAMGVEHVELNIGPDQIDSALLRAELDRLAAYGLTAVILSCSALQKNDVIDLNLKEKDGKAVSRDREIERFNRFVRVSADAGIHTVSVAWQPSGIKRTCHKAGEHTRGGVSAFVDMEEIGSRPNDYGREYTEEEVWDNFRYFLEHVSETCRESGVRLALHPNDPPVPSLCGVASLIYNTEGYRRAFAMDRDNVVGVKLCIGCWLEGGDRLGDLMRDSRDFMEDDRIVSVHFRNVSSTLPVFEETLSEDGYGDMYAIMKQLAACGYEGPISIDHAFKGSPAMGGMLGAFAYPTGHMKGLLHAAEAELGKRENPRGSQE